MEISMLSILDFNVDFVSSHSCLERFVQITMANKKTKDLAQYILEITMLDFQSIVMLPSNLAVGSLLLANKILKNLREHHHSKTLLTLVKVTEAEMTPQIEYLLKLLKNYQKPGSQLMGLKKKFSSEKFSNISTYF